MSIKIEKRTSQRTEFVGEIKPGHIGYTQDQVRRVDVDLFLATDENGKSGLWCTSEKAAIKSLENHLKVEAESALFTDYQIIGVVESYKLVSTLLDDGYVEVGPDAVQVGDVAVAYGRGAYRQGVVVRVTKTRVVIEYTTPGAVNDMVRYGSKSPGRSRATSKTCFVKR